jgi:hypothetical protein
MMSVAEHVPTQRQGGDKPSKAPSIQVVAETSPELAAVLDAEYREFVRSLHKDTIAVIVAFESWWTGAQVKTPGCFTPAVLAGAGHELRARDQRAAAVAEEEWRRTIHPKLSMLINGHPDPDVREAADVLDKRSFEPIVMFDRPPAENKSQSEENKLAIRLIHDALTKLRLAAYHAPFRVHRPEPDWNGVPTGNEEGLPHDILKRIKERGEHYQG